MTTEVFTGAAAYSRTAYLDIVNDKVVFDSSDGEYGPIEFPLEILIESIDNHLNNLIKESITK